MSLLETGLCPSERPIEDFALIGSTHSAALIDRDGTIAWLSLPRFDSDAMFASLLGSPDNGAWALGAADRDGATVTRRYLPNTMILETTIETATGKAEVLDFMPLPETDHVHEVVRIVKGIEGTVDLETEIRLRFNYGLSKPWVQRKEGAIIAIAGPDAVRLSSTIDMQNADFATGARFNIAAGETAGFMLEWYPSRISPPVSRDSFALFHRTSALWEGWAERYKGEGPYEELVRRSLLTLKAMTYRPSGGIVAAPTTSLPEWPGGDRNWDYRFCWLRDAVLTIHALGVSGFYDEASDWRWWLMRAVAGAPDELQIMYGLEGERRLPEYELDHLSGFQASRPVHVGNAASEQVQLDVYGSVLAAFDAARRAGIAEMDAVWPLQRAIAEHLLKIWKEPDSGLWEVRGPPRHFVHSKMMCWLAFDRMVASAKDFELEGDVDAWTTARDEIHAQICEKGFDEEANSFMQYYGASGVDAALLQMPILGFLPPDDPRILGTVARVEQELLRDGVVYRYITGDGSDGLKGKEGAFLACSFWLAAVYALVGRQEDGEALFAHVASLANDVGLLAEEWDPAAKRQLGNYPQAFSHLALIHAAHVLGGASRAGDLLPTHSSNVGSSV